MIKALINLFISFKKVFKGQRYCCQKIGYAYFIYNHYYDRVTKDYYEYVESLLSRHLIAINNPCVILLDCEDFSWLKIFLPIKKIVFQIEHTLVKSGARDCEDAFPGSIAISDGAEKYLVRLSNRSKLQNASAVIEYSRINQLNVRHSPELALYALKTFCISPALYPLLEYSPSTAGPRALNTITLFGNPDEPRRKKFLNTLSELKVANQNINNVFDRLEDLYRNTKILINIRQTDHHDTLEELRVLPALRCGVIVISERAPLIKETGYSQYIIWGELHELPALVIDVQNNYEFWHEKIFENPGFTSRMQRISRRNELVSLKVLEYLNTL